MSIFMIIALDIVITLHFSINCSAAICSPTAIFSILREASSETYGPRVYFPSYKFLIYNFSFRFTSFAIFYFLIYKPKIPKILLYRLSISIRSHFANNCKGIDNPFITLGASWCLFVHVLGGLLCLSPTGLIPWFSKAEGNSYSTLLHHSFLFKGKANTSSRGSRKNFWRRCRGDLCQVKSHGSSPVNLPISGTVAGEIYDKSRYTK